MNWLIVPQNKIAEMAALNTATQALAVSETEQGILLIGADKLADAMWSNWHPFLLSLEVFSGEPVWKTSEE